MSKSDQSPFSSSTSARTSRLYLRPIRPDDAPDVFECRSDPEIMQWSTSRPETSIQQTEDWIRHRFLENTAEVANFSMELLDSGVEGDTTRNKVIGCIGAVRGPEVGYMISRAYHNRGYATEAMRAFLTLFWGIVPRPANPPKHDGAALSAQHLEADANVPRALARGWDYVEAIVDPENTASARVLVKCGFTLWSTTRDDYNSVNLGTRSTAIYRLARPGSKLGKPPGPFEIDMGPELVGAPP